MRTYKDIQNTLARMVDDSGLYGNPKLSYEAESDLCKAETIVGKYAKIQDILEGTIDHFDLEDAMDVLYDIKRVLKEQ